MDPPSTFNSVISNILLTVADMNYCCCCCCCCCYYYYYYYYYNMQIMTKITTITPTATKKLFKTSFFFFAEHVKASTIKGDPRQRVRLPRP